ncbi:MAG: DUF86 domain-containing protein [Bacilli bacterium]|nr:DUF86 domain-containing protein [Bacilli bacterium]
MDNIKDDAYYVSKTIDEILIIKEYVKDLSIDDLNNNNLLMDAIMFRLIQMAEHMSHLSLQFRNTHSCIQWGLISGFRNGIVHNYGKTDNNIVIQIINNDLDNLILDLKKGL